MNRAGEMGIAGVVNGLLVLFVAVWIQFLIELFYKGLECNTIFSYRYVISAYHKPIGFFSVGKHIRVSDIITEIFDTRMPQSRYWLIRDVRKVIDFPDSLNSERLELKSLTYKLTMFLALTVLSMAHEICYLDNRYLVTYSFSYILHFPNITTTAKKGKLRTHINKNDLKTGNIYVLWKSSVFVFSAEVFHYPKRGQT